MVFLDYKEPPPAACENLGPSSSRCVVLLLVYPPWNAGNAALMCWCDGKMSWGMLLSVSSVETDHNSLNVQQHHQATTCDCDRRIAYWQAMLGALVVLNSSAVTVILFTSTYTLHDAFTATQHFLLNSNHLFLCSLCQSPSRRLDHKYWWHCFLLQYRGSFKNMLVLFVVHIEYRDDSHETKCPFFLNVMKYLLRLKLDIKDWRIARITIH